jgi:hypothetical protein
VDMQRADAEVRTGLAPMELVASATDERQRA